jgi:hypothetical protein
MRPGSLNRNMKPRRLWHGTKTYEYEPSAFFHAAADICEGLDWIIEEHDAKTRIHQISPARLEAVCRIGQSAAHVAKSSTGATVPGEVEHWRRNIDAQHGTRWPNDFGECQQRITGAASDIDYVLTRLGPATARLRLVTAVKTSLITACCEIQERPIMPFQNSAPREFSAGMRRCPGAAGREPRANSEVVGHSGLNPTALTRSALTAISFRTYA